MKSDMPFRLITATALFDGHDVSINLFRNLLVRKGVEVIHLGHSRSVEEIVSAAVQEDVDAILVSSYQGGHNEFFRYTVDSLKANGCDHILVFGGGGGVILPEEIRNLEAYGVCRLYHSDDGQRLGLNGIAEDILNRLQKKRDKTEKKHAPEPTLPVLSFDKPVNLGRVLSQLENEGLAENATPDQKHPAALVIGITGTGGSGKSSLTDELVNRFLKVSPDIRIAILSADPTKSTSNGALLGDRIRMNAIYHPRVFMRSFATRQSNSELPAVMDQAVKLLSAAGAQVIFLETSGIGQGDHAVTRIADTSIYVMTTEYGSPSQLEKINMLDLADF